MAPFKKQRTLIETDLYRQGVDALKVSWRRLDEILEGITHKIAVEPDYFPLLPGIEARRALTNKYLPDVPRRFAVWFTVDGETIILQHIETYSQDENFDPVDDYDPDAGLDGEDL
jgi:hypothetical protein